jgi:hypothetical protein
MLSGLSYAIDTPTGTPQGGSMNRNRWVWVGIYAARKIFRLGFTLYSFPIYLGAQGGRGSDL